MKRLLLKMAAAGALLFAPALAQAAEGVATANVNMRAGPSTAYPAVVVIPAGASLEIRGCLADVPWCDVEFYGGRGWVAGRYVQALYQRQRVYVAPQYYRPLGIPTVSFSVGNYWDRYYRNRDFYRERDRWRRSPPRPEWDGPRPGWNRPPPSDWDRDSGRRGRDWDRDNDRGDRNWDRDNDRGDRNWDRDNNRRDRNWDRDRRQEWDQGAGRPRDWDGGRDRDRDRNRDRDRDRDNRDRGGWEGDRRSGSDRGPDRRPDVEARPDRPERRQPPPQDQGEFAPQPQQEAPAERPEIRKRPPVPDYMR